MHFNKSGPTVAALFLSMQGDVVGTLTNATGTHGFQWSR